MRVGSSGPFYEQNRQAGGHWSKPSTAHRKALHKGFFVLWQATSGKPAVLADGLIVGQSFGFLRTESMTARSWLVVTMNLCPFSVRFARGF